MNGDIKNGRRTKRVVIAGGGIAGLSAAYYLQKSCKEREVPVEIILLEKSRRLGGKIETLRKDGFVIERGPDSFLARKTSILELTKDLGMLEELVGMRQGASHSYILHRQRLHAIPSGFIMGVPTKWRPFVTTRLLSVKGKARAAADLILPRKAGHQDESLGGLLRRRLGDEVLERIAEPLLAGIYAGNADALSVQATFPMLQEVEEKHRSLILGMLGRKGPGGGGRAGQAQAQAFPLPESAGRSMFLSYRNGLESLVDRLVSSLEDVVIEKEAKILELKKEEDGYLVRASGGREYAADGIVLATPAYVTANLLPQGGFLHSLQTIPYASVMNVALAYDTADVRVPLNASGFVVPRKEGRTITACTWTSSKWEHTAPGGKVLLRVYAGKYGQEQPLTLRDEELIQAVRKDLEEIMGVRAAPVFSEVNRIPLSMPHILSDTCSYKLNLAAPVSSGAFFLNYCATRRLSSSPQQSNCILRLRLDLSNVLKQLDLSGWPTLDLSNEISHKGVIFPAKGRFDWKFPT